MRKRFSFFSESKKSLIQELFSRGGWGRALAPLEFLELRERFHNFFAHLGFSVKYCNQAARVTKNSKNRANFDKFWPDFIVISNLTAWL